MTPEGKVVAAIKRETKALGGDTRKVEWSGRRGAPDLLVLLPGMHFFIEAKAPGEKPRPEQLREHDRLRKAGIDVYVLDNVDSVKDFFECCADALLLGLRSVLWLEK